MHHAVPTLASSLLALIGVLPLSAENEAKLEVIVPRLSAIPAFEDFAGMQPATELARQMSSVGQFIQREPSDGAPASQETKVYFGYDAANLYVVFLAFDEPQKVRATLSRREDVFEDDLVEIMLDTFKDQRRAYAFACNPVGVQWDAIWTEGQGFDDSFDTVWHSEGIRTDQGYMVRMTFLVNPWTALYVGTNSNYANDRFLRAERRVIPTRNLHNDSRQIFVKYSHLFRL